jgi:deoxyhypusine synthase
MKSRETVEQVVIRPGMSVDQLVRELSRAGAYNGGALARAADLCEEMFRDKGATRFLGLAGAMVPAGMGGLVSDLVEHRYIDVLVSTGANLTHDIIEAIGCRHYQVLPAVLISAPPGEINRIYDVHFNEAFRPVREFMQEIPVYPDPAATR